MAREDITGQIFNRLTAIAYSHSKNGKTYWRYMCECGNETVAIASEVKNNYTKSCGCLQRAVTVERLTTHGLTGSDTYISWAAMVQRCTNDANPRYKDYGGRGITVCKEWRESFASFFADLGERPEGTTLDRIDNNGPYAPGNCRWADDDTQRNNRRNNRLIEYQGESKTITEWAKEVQLSKALLHYRLGNGWSVERALTEPVRKAT